MGLRQRLVLLLAIVLVAYGGVHTWLTARSQRLQILSEATTSALRLSNTIRRSTRHAMQHSRPQDVREIINDIGEQEGIDHVRIFNKEGVIMYSADPTEIQQVVDRDAQACSQCHEAEMPLTRLETAKRARVFEEGDHRTLAAIDVIYNEPSCAASGCHPAPQAQPLLGVVDVGVSLADADRRVAESTQNAALLGLASAAVICGLIAVFFSRFVNRPVQRLLHSTQQVARGNLESKIPVAHRDELGQLAVSFNEMTDDLRKAQTELSSWAHKLEAEIENKTRELRLAQAQIVRSEKLSSLGMMAAGVAHELNSPLTGILTFAHLLAKKMPEGSREKDDVDIIISQTNRCATIIRQLLDFSRETSPEKRPQDLHRVIDQAIALVEHQALFHDIDIRREFASELPEVPLDGGQMQQVFLNLLINAGEAMPDGGELTIRTVPSTVGEPERGGTPSKAVTVVVRDTGIGISQDLIGKVFDPFFTSKDVGKGTGLGLAVTYGIIERHGGTIEVESTPGEGTQFTIQLPLVSNGPGPTAEPESRPFFQEVR